MSESYGIPTTYRGLQFRSRAEARWAAFFDLLGWRWRYEPFDFAGYIPDFLIEEKVLVEVKGGEGSYADLSAHIKSPEWQRRHESAARFEEILVLAAFPVDCNWGAPLGAWSARHPVYPRWHGPRQEKRALPGQNLTLDNLFKNLSSPRERQDLPPVGFKAHPEEAFVGSCSGCARLTPNNGTGVWMCRFCNTGGKESFRGTGTEKYIEKAWAEASNQTQWRRSA